MSQLTKGHPCTLCDLFFLNSYAITSEGVKRGRECKVAGRAGWVCDGVEGGKRLRGREASREKEVRGQGGGLHTS